MSKSNRLEDAIQLIILLLVGLMAGAASFTHVHEWTMANSPAGTGEWFGWANAVISELTPTASGLEVRRRKRNGQPIAYPMAVLIASAALSIAAQIAVAKPHPTGWLIAAIPALAFLALTKLVLSRTTTPPATAVPESANALQTAVTPPAHEDQEHADTTDRTLQRPPALPVLNLPTPALEGHR
ncbi:hypothetical protein ACFWY5_37235 [Nonomuraea sp. NPDC059007]|uniref:hypothetical protein n=1 Tax=Nonomuraea sp. NPDC059007 TaxID=3346692 RepID=UPI0036B299C1